MTSGIYIARFKDDTFYIGKSINMENRWKQHIDDFRKGKHTAKMQRAYECCGLPEFDFLCTAHSDHIDLLEGLFIDQMRSPLMLNSASVSCPSDEDIRVFTLFPEKLQLSTADHIRLMAQMEEDVNKFSKRADTYLAELNRYSAEGIYTEGMLLDKLKELGEVTGDLQVSLDIVEELNADLRKGNENLQSKLSRLESNWFVKLFL